MEGKCFCGSPAKNQNIAEDKRGLDYLMVYIYPTCYEHWDLTPPKLWAIEKELG